MGTLSDGIQVARLKKQVRKADDPEAKAAAQQELVNLEATLKAQSEATKVAKGEAVEQKAEQKRAEEFAASPQGRARAAKEGGSELFQISLPVSATEKAFWGDTALSGSSMMTKTRDRHPSGDLDLIEVEGWRLEHVGYVFQPTGTQSRDRLIASGQVETIVGNVIGVYLFRLTGSEHIQAAEAALQP